MCKTWDHYHEPWRSLVVMGCRGTWLGEDTSNSWIREELSRRQVALLGHSSRVCSSILTSGFCLDSLSCSSSWVLLYPPTSQRQTGELNCLVYVHGMPTRAYWTHYSQNSLRIQNTDQNKVFMEFEKKRKNPRGNRYNNNSPRTVLRIEPYDPRFKQL